MLWHLPKGESWLVGWFEMFGFSVKQKKERGAFFVGSHRDEHDPTRAVFFAALTYFSPPNNNKKSSFLAAQNTQHSL